MQVFFFYRNTASVNVDTCVSRILANWAIFFVFNLDVVAPRLHVTPVINVPNRSV
jgi:hypothetical protein